MEDLRKLAAKQKVEVEEVSEVEELTEGITGGFEAEESFNFDKTLEDLSGEKADVIYDKVDGLILRGRKTLYRTRVTNFDLMSVYDVASELNEITDKMNGELSAESFNGTSRLDTALNMIVTLQDYETGKSISLDTLAIGERYLLFVGIQKAIMPSVNEYNSKKLNRESRRKSK